MIAKKVLRTDKYTVPLGDSLRTVRTKHLLGHLSINNNKNKTKKLNNINCQEPKIFLKIPIHLN